MENTTTCKVVEKQNAERLTICGQWGQTDLRLLVIKNDGSALRGRTTYDSFSQFSKRLTNFRNAPVKKFIDHNIQIFENGSLENIEFSLEDGQLAWGNSAWQYNVVDLESADSGDFTNFISLLCDSNKSKHLRIANMESDLNKSIQERMKLNELLTHLTAEKIEFENTIYQVFVPLLNSKKDRVKKLMEELETFREIPPNERIYYCSTEEFEVKENSQPAKKPSPHKKKLDGRAVPSQSSSSEDLDAIQDKARADFTVRSPKKAKKNYARDGLKRKMTHEQQQNLKSPTRRFLKRKETLDDRADPPKSGVSTSTSTAVQEITIDNFADQSSSDEFRNSKSSTSNFTSRSSKNVEVPEEQNIDEEVEKPQTSPLSLNWIDDKSEAESPEIEKKIYRRVQENPFDCRIFQNFHEAKQTTSQTYNDICNSEESTPSDLGSQEPLDKRPRVDESIKPLRTQQVSDIAIDSKKNLSDKPKPKEESDKEDFDFKISDDEDEQEEPSSKNYVITPNIVVEDSEEEINFSQ